MNIIVFGNVPLCTYTLQKLNELDNIRVIGVVCDEHPPDAFSHHGVDLPATYHYCLLNQIPILSMEGAEEEAYKTQILGISVRFNKIFRKRFYSQFHYGIINFHGGELPRYRGSNIANQVILDGVPRGAGTLHYIDEGIDEGDIVSRSFFSIDHRDTAQDVFNKTYKALMDAADELAALLTKNEKLPNVKQDDLIAQGETAGTYTREKVNNQKEILSHKVNTVDLDRVARAFHFHGHEPAYILQGHQKIYLTPYDCL